MEIEKLHNMIAQAHVSITLTPEGTLIIFDEDTEYQTTASSEEFDKVLNLLEAKIELRKRKKKSIRRMDMIKVILNYDPVSGTLYDKNNQSIASYTGLQAEEMLSVEELVKLKNAGYETADIIEMKRAGLL